MNSLFDKQMVDMWAMTQDSLKDYIGKTIADISIREYFEDYPGDKPIESVGVVIRFTDGDYCLFGNITFVSKN